MGAPACCPRPRLRHRVSGCCDLCGPREAASLTRQPWLAACTPLQRGALLAQAAVSQSAGPWPPRAALPPKHRVHLPAVRAALARGGVAEGVSAGAQGLPSRALNRH